MNYSIKTWLIKPGPDKLIVMLRAVGLLLFLSTTSLPLLSGPIQDWHIGDNPFVQTLIPLNHEEYYAAPTLPECEEGVALMLPQPFAPCDQTPDTIRVNMGGGDLGPDAEGREWTSYTAFNLPGSTYANGAAASNADNSDSPPTSSVELYARGQFDQTLDMHFPVPNGDYTVVLHFSDNASFTGQRVFDITLENTKVEDDFDIFTQAGGQYVALARAYDVTVDGNDLSVLLVSETVNAIIHGIEIIPKSSAVLTKSVDLDVDVTGCYFANGESSATVQARVNWNNAVPGDVVNISLGGVTRTIRPGMITVAYAGGYLGRQVIVSPQDVSFEVPADGAAGMITANFNGDVTCETTVPFTAPAACEPTTCAGGSGVVGGYAFIDNNRDGINQPGELLRETGVAVRIYGSDAAANSTLVASTTTDAFGNYSFSGLTDGERYRVEFDFPGGAGLDQTVNGTSNRTSVQFVTAPTCGALIGITDSEVFCQDNPQVLVPCYVKGNHLGSGANRSALVGFPYLSNGAPASGPITNYATIGAVGALWGMAHDKHRDVMYSASTMKRHNGLLDRPTAPAEGMLGGIFVTDMTAPPASSTSFLVDLEAIGAELGFIGNDVARGLTLNFGPDTDATAFAKVGKAGIGDIDVTPDGNFLFYTNLFERKLGRVRMDDDDNPSTPYTPVSGDLVEFDLPAVACAGSGTLRPWALKVYQGKVYVGAVCDAMGGSKGDLQAFVFSFDVTSEAFDATPAFDFPLTYPKGFPAGNLTSTFEDRTGWHPWTDDFSDIRQGWPIANNWIILYPVPILSDIEFDIDGAMVLGFMDRTSQQIGYLDLDPSGGPTPYNIVAGGDVLRAYFSNGNFILENNAKAGPATGYGPGNNQGPGLGEFYNDDYAPNNPAHAESFLGGLALRPGSGEVMATALDPTLTTNTNGVRRLSNTTGQTTAAFEIVNSVSGTNRKGNSLGDLELACALLTEDVQIGGYLWTDTNPDGIQASVETPIEGVTVQLFDPVTGDLLATTTTDANGEYYFTEGDTNTPGGQPLVLDPNTSYEIVFGSGQYDTTTGELTVGDNVYMLGTPAVGQGPDNTLNDSDGVPLAGTPPSTLGSFAGFPSISATTPSAGGVDHSFDVGFNPICNLVSLTASASGCNSDNNGHNVAGTISVTGAPTSGTLTVMIPGFGGGMQTFDAPFTSPIDYSIDGVASNGLERSVIATFSENGGMCANTVMYLAPEQCLSCVCNNFIYLNEPGAGTVLKFRVEADSTLTLVSDPFAAGIGSPHGLGIDNNGFIYVGSFTTGRIHKYSCDGDFIEILPASITVQQQNTVVKGNYLYTTFSNSQFVQCFDLCTYQRVGYLDFAGTGGSWGLSEGEDGNLYVAGGSGGQPVIVYQFPPDPALFKLTDITVYDTPYWDTNPGLVGNLTGIDVDEFGNVYLAIINQGTVYKVAPDGTILFQVTDPGVGNGSGWANAFGIVYNRETQQLYTSQNNANEDCIAVFDAADLTYRADLIVPANPPLTGKGIGILQECCPTLDSVRVDTTICARAGVSFELNKLLPCSGLCAQPTPSGGWTRSEGTGGTFNECDLSFTVDELTTSSCFKFSGGSIGGACFPYVIDICFNIVDMTPPEIAGNACSDPAGEELSVSVLSTGVSNITYQWQRSTIGCVGFLDIPGAVGLTYTPTSPAQRTFYRVKATSPDGLECEQFSNCLRVELDTMTTTMFCDGGTNSVTFNAADDLTDVVWFNEADVEVGTGASLLVSGLTPGLEDGQENFRYTALDAEGEPYPSACPFRVVTSVVSLTASAGNCDNDNNGHNVAGTITVTNPPTTGTLTIMIPGFGGGMQTFDAPFTSPIDYSIDGVASNGLERSVIATFSDNGGMCADTVTYLAPEQCLSCTCNNFIYLNEPGAGTVLKFRVEADSSLTLVGDPFASGIGSPHGLGIDANGFLYIGSATTRQIFKYTCDGTYVETLPFTVLQTNTVIKGNYLYTTVNNANFVQCFDLCTNQRVGYLDFAGIGPSWGLSEGEDGNLYVAGGTGIPAQPIIVYQFPADPALFKLSGITVYNTPYFTNNPMITGTQTGVDVDEFGNVYLADMNQGTVYKIAPDGTILAQVTDPVSGNGTGFRNAFGIVYNRETKQLYTSQNNPNEDCIAVFDTEPLAYRGDLRVPATPPLRGKGIGILQECCPTLDSIRIDTTVCATAGVSFELNELLPCSGLCAQPTPGGGWTRSEGTGGTFNDCDLSFTVDELTTSSCFKFSGGSIGGACFPYVIDICFNIVEMTPPEIFGPVCSDPAGEELSVSVLSTGVSNITYQWQRSTIGCLGFLDIPGAVGLTYTPTSPAQRTFYRVKATSPDGLECEQFSNCLRVELDTMTTTTLCNGGTNSVTFNAAANLTDVVWFNEADEEVGTGASLLVSGTTAGLEDGQENFRYTAMDADGAPYPSACPFRVITETCLDLGDLPPNYPTSLADNGPSHVLVSGLGIGATVDEDTDGVPSALADGDGADEDGITNFPAFNPGQPAPITVNVRNNQEIPADAILYGFIDWNGDGDFDDENETVSITVPAGTNGDVILPFEVPTTAVPGIDLGVRIRLSTDTGLGATGSATNGEIEDYLIQVPPCTIAISSLMVDCSDNSTFMVSFSVDYDFGNAATDMIQVTIGGVAQAPIATTGSSGSIPVGPVSVPGPAYDVLIEAAFVNNPLCLTRIAADLIACSDPCTTGLGGTAFNDFDNDGVGPDTDTNDEGQENVLVEVYDCNGMLVCETYTDANGDWSCPMLTNTTEQYRVEFSTPLQPYLQPSVAGADNGTNTQFVVGGNCDVDYGVIDPNENCEANPSLMTSCFVSGATTATGDNSVLIKWPYLSSGLATASQTIEGTKDQMGTVWGLAYARNTQTLFSSTFLKRHAGLPDFNGDNEGDLENIYVTDIANGGTTLWLDLGTQGIDAGTIPDDAGRGLSLPEAPTSDSLAYGKIGEEGLGDLEISSDFKTLFSVNLFTKELMVIDIATKLVTNRYPIPDPGCVGGSPRPFALKYYENKVYVGVTCDASVSQDYNNLSATVYQFDPAMPANGFVSILDIPLNYTKGFPNTGCGGKNRWFAWYDWPLPAGVNPNCTANFALPQPLLTDLEFDTDGSLIMAFVDRYGHQNAAVNLEPDGSDRYDMEILAGGDLLRAYLDDGTYLLESGGTAGNVSGSANNQGPGGGEFYNGEFIACCAGASETAVGGVALLPGLGELAATVWDPFRPNGGIGVNFLSNTNGTAVRRYEIGESPSFGKGGGLGDLELLCSPPPIQIGNYAWVDTNGDGIQSPCEPPLVGLMVKLYTKPASGEPVQVASTTTDANGNYFFIGNGLDDATWIVSDTIEAGERFFVAFCGDEPLNPSNNTIQVGGENYCLTLDNVGEGNNPDQNDSDATLQPLGSLGTFPAYCTVAGEVDTTNHNFDVGFKPNLEFDLAIFKVVDGDATPPPYVFGQVVKFNMGIVSQGELAATAVEITDIIPPGLHYDPTFGMNAATGWVGGAGASAVSLVINPTLAGINITNPGQSLAQGDTALVSIWMRIDEVSNPSGDGDYTNYGEISSGTYIDPTTMTALRVTSDGDSPYGLGVGNDTGGGVGTDDDDQTLDNRPGEDIDSQDPAFVFVNSINCPPQITLADPFTICSTGTITLNAGASIIPEDPTATWSTTDGTGTFDGGTTFSTATTYSPSSEDAQRGSVTLVLTSSGPIGSCPPESRAVTIQILKVDCGSMFWDGND